MHAHAREHDAATNALAKAAPGRFISEDAMTAWFESLGTAHELPEPSADVIIERD